MKETADILFPIYDLCPWRSGSHGGLSILRMWVRVQVTESFFNVFFFSFIITVRFQY